MPTSLRVRPSSARLPETLPDGEEALQRPCQNPKFQAGVANHTTGPRPTQMLPSLWRHILPANANMCTVMIGSMATIGAITLTESVTLGAFIGLGSAILVKGASMIFGSHTVQVAQSAKGKRPQTGLKILVNALDEAAHSAELFADMRIAITYDSSKIEGVKRTISVNNIEPEQVINTIKAWSR